MNQCHKKHKRLEIYKDGKCFSKISADRIILHFCSIIWALKVIGVCVGGKTNVFAPPANEANYFVDGGGRYGVVLVGEVAGGEVAGGVGNI
jgi:hypothetical protein